MKSEDIVKVENLNRGNGFVIRWSLTYLCNYSCDFCIQGSKQEHIEKSKDESKETRKKICDNLIKFIETKLNKNYDYIDLYLIGGEITILEDFLEIIEKIINCKFDGLIIIKITTNLSTKKEVLENLMEIVENNKKSYREIHINASYYKEFANEEEFIDKIKLLIKNDKVSNAISLNTVFRRIKKLFKKYRRAKVVTKFKNKIRKMYVSIGYPLCEDSDYDQYLKFKNKLKKVTKNIHFIIIKGYKTSISEKLKKRIVKEEKQDKNIKVTFNNNEVFYCQNNNKISLKLENEQSFNSKGYICDVGLNNITISNKGDIARCVSCKEATKIGNILNWDFELPTDKIICPINKCNCSYFKVIEKGVN